MKYSSKIQKKEEESEVDTEMDDAHELEVVNKALVEEIDLIMIQDIEEWINTLIKNKISFGDLFDFMNSVFDESFYDLIISDMERCKNNLSESESLIHFGIINIELKNGVTVKSIWYTFVTLSYNTEHKVL